MRAVRSAVISVLMVFSAAGCASFNRSEPEGTLLRESERGRLISNLDAERDRRTSFRYLSNSVFTYRDEVNELRHAVVAVAPDKLRLEALASQAAISFSLFVLNGTKATFLDFNEKTFLDGEAGSGLLQEALRLPLYETDLLWLLGGALSPRLTGNVAEVYYDESSRRYTLTGRENLFTARYEGEPLRLTSLEVRSPFDEHTDIRLTYTWRRISNLPAVIKVVLPRYDVTLDMNVTNPKEDPEVADKLFAVTIPSSFSEKKRKGE